MKVCKSCKENKDISLFRKSSKYTRNNCKKCEKKIKIN